MIPDLFQTIGSKDEAVIWKGYSFYQNNGNLIILYAIKIYNNKLGELVHIYTISQTKNYIIR